MPFERTQQGPLPKDIKRANYPLDVREEEVQTETRQKKAFVLTSEKMPTIELIEKQSGQIGTTSPQTIKPLREPIEDTIKNPEANLRTQYIKEGEI